METPGTTSGGVTATRVAVPTRSARVALTLVAALLAGMLGGLGGTTGGPATPAGDLTRVIVQARQDLGAVATAVARQGGEVVDMLSSFGMVVADVPADRIAPLQADPATGSVAADQPMRVQSADDVEAEAVAAADDAERPTAGDGGGDGVGVVLVDTGIDHDSLDDDVVARYDLSPSEKLDGHGHGTFMAGIVDTQAPDSHLVSVQVADDDGTTTLSRVLHGLAIADAARELHDAPVVLLAMAGDVGNAPDPIMTTLEMLWARGSTVVVPSGNRGADQVTSPGADPYLITVGARDADFSGNGEVFGKQKPEVEAPGVGVTGLRVVGSTIDQNWDGDGAFTGSGTSMAAAHVAGVAASMLSTNPALSPDDVKSELVADQTYGVEGATDNSGLAPLPSPAGNDRGAERFLNPGALRRTANDLAPAGWTWTGWTWTGWTWTGWTWTGWTWTGWTWTGWTWTAASWGDEPVV